MTFVDDLGGLALAPTLAEVGSKMVSLASVESNQDLAIALRRLGKTWEAAGSIAQAQVRIPRGR